MLYSNHSLFDLFIICSLAKGNSRVGGTLFGGKLPNIWLHLVCFFKYTGAAKCYNNRRFQGTELLLLNTFFDETLV